MYYIIDDDESTRYPDVDAVCEVIFDPQNYDDDSAVEEWVNETWPRYEIGGYEFSAGEIAREMNSYLWSELCSEWAESQSESDKDYYYSDIEALDEGEEEWFGNFKVRAMADTDEEDEEEIKNEFADLLQPAYVIKTLSDNPASVQVLR